MIKNELINYLVTQLATEIVDARQETSGNKVLISSNNNAVVELRLKEGDIKRVDIGTQNQSVINYINDKKLIINIDQVESNFELLYDVKISTIYLNQDLIKYNLVDYGAFTYEKMIKEVNRNRQAKLTVANIRRTNQQEFDGLDVPTKFVQFEGIQKAYKLDGNVLFIIG